MLHNNNNNTNGVYDFSQLIDRKGTSCVKHDMMNRDFGRNDLLAMWVADMDFATPDFIMEAIKQRCEHNVLGYTYAGKEYFQAVMWWLKRHYSIDADKEELHYVPGIVAGIAFAIQAFTREGDKIMITTPVYPPFIHLPHNNNRTLVESPLYIKDGRFCINFDDLREKVKGCKMFILSNPHNPGGTVWSNDELRQIAEICHQNNCMVISDEIHADLNLHSQHANTFSIVSDIAKEISITFIAPSKTFNIPGLASSVAYIPNETLRKQYFNYIDGYELANGNVFAYVGATAAFSEQGEKWLEQLKLYILENIKALKTFFDTKMPKIRYMVPEASYLVWLDFSGYGLTHQEVKDRLINKAGVALNDGTDFGGKDYECCFRINIGCPISTLKQGLEKIYTAFEL